MIDCIIPAAGTSSRMRAWKLFLPYKDKPVIDHVLLASLGAADTVIVVTGFQSAALEEHILSSNLSKERIIIAQNREYNRGMFSSIQEGLRYSEGDLFFVLLADLPLMRASILQKILSYRKSLDTPPDIIQPVYQRHPGHPVLFSGAVREAILSMPPSASMRQVFVNFELLQLPIDDPAIISDIDTPESYHALIRR